jgi:OmcA/MtrC family decaheme c-type cytochrome
VCSSDLNVTLVGYDRTKTHRVSVYMGGHNGPTGEGDFDFVPNGSSVTATRNIVVTATCKNCHGPEFSGHGGDRVTVEGCVTCHSPNSAMVNSSANGGRTETIEMAVMIHKIHAGRELASSRGADGEFYDNPWTAADETADNYASYAYTVGNINASWRTAAFPAVLSNCQACHNGSVSEVDNWKNVPSRAAGGSCHDDINWTTGANHAGGQSASDAGCVICHPASGNGFGQSVAGAHDWTQKDIRNKPEFDITITTDTPSRGYYVNG